MVRQLHRAIRRDVAPPAACHRYWRRRESARRHRVCVGAKKSARHRPRVKGHDDLATKDRWVESFGSMRELDRWRTEQSVQQPSRRPSDKPLTPLGGTIQAWYGE